MDRCDGAGGARPSLPMLLRDKLETRVLAADVDRAAFVTLGLDYLQQVSEPVTLMANVCQGKCVPSRRATQMFMPCRAAKSTRR